MGLLYSLFSENKGAIAPLFFAYAKSKFSHSEFPDLEKGRVVVGELN